MEELPSIQDKLTSKKSKMDMLLEESFSPSKPGIVRASVRKVRRLLRGSSRRHLIALSSLLCLIFYWSRTTGTASETEWASSNLITCVSARENRHSILPPSAPDPALLSQTWKTLQNLYERYPPQPLTLKLNNFASISTFPSLEEIKHHTDISKSDALTSRQNHAEVIDSIPPIPQNQFAGRGVVMLAGGKYSEYAATGLGMLREVGSRLPVEVWMKDKTEEKDGWCDELAREGMACRRLSDYMDLTALEHPYQWKVFTIMFSSFAEVLFIDGDNMPIQNPDDMFEAEDYAATGVVLWPDYWKNTGSPFLPFVMGISDEASEMMRDQKTVESGELLWNKERHWEALCLAAYYNYYGPKYYYTLISQGWAGWGDKDTFPIALQSLHKDCYMVPYGLRAMFVNGTGFVEGMIQSNPSNKTGFEPMFWHMNMVKWSIRNLLCVGCSSDPEGAVAASALENEQSPMHAHLKEGRPIISKTNMESFDMNPEPLVWKSMEHTTCRSVWKNAELCARTREHMTKAFGFQFRAGRIATILGYGDRLCVRDS